MQKTKTNQSKARGQGHYKLVFKPAEYTGKLSRWNDDYENGPLITWKHMSRERCYMLVKKYKFTLARIYDMNSPAETVDAYSVQSGWATAAPNA